MSKKLPKTLYARVESDGDETYFIAHDFLDDTVQEEGVTRVGLYKLESVADYRRVSELVKEG